MKIAISQPRYLPALNYLQRIHISDIFVILDNVQHQRRAFEHRNKIKSTNKKGVWCSIPLKRDSSRMKINELVISDPNWIEKHKLLMTSYYSKAKFFDKNILDEIYKNLTGLDFVENIYNMTINICNLLDIKYNFVFSSTLNLISSNDKLLYDIVKKLKGTEYISGPNGRNYINKNLFHDIKLIYHEFNFPYYKQLYGEFIPWMSIIDQLFNVGVEQTKKYIFATPILKEE